MTAFIKTNWRWTKTQPHAQFKYECVLDEHQIEKLRIKWPGGMLDGKRIWEGIYLPSKHYNQTPTARIGFDLTEEEIVKLWAELFL